MSNYIAFEPAGVFCRGEARSTKGGLVRGSPRRGSRAKPLDAREVSKFFEKIKKNLDFLKISIENLSILKVF